MATCDSPPMVSSQQQEHGGQKLDAAAEDNSVIAMETGFAHSSNNANNAHRSSPVVAAVIGESENGLGDPALSPLRTTPTPTATTTPTTVSVSGNRRPCVRTEPERKLYYRQQLECYRDFTRRRRGRFGLRLFGPRHLSSGAGQGHPLQRMFGLLL
ncbi:unnamed protein product [Gadus morhua 'NCC']